ncbi:MAG: 50S ribosomal protein L5 [Gammaproteobacteria bacterium]
MSATSTPAAQPQAMRTIRVGKVVVNIGVGKSGEALERAKQVLAEISAQAPSTRAARKTIRDFGIHRGEPIGVAMTLRRDRAEDALKRLLGAKDLKLQGASFDSFGNCSFGIREHIEIPGAKYKPEVGIFGLDVSVVLERPGYRVARRRRARSSVGTRHRVTRDEAIGFFQQRLGVQVN